MRGSGQGISLLGCGLVVVTFGWWAVAESEAKDSARATDERRVVGASSEARDEESRRWFVFLQLVNAYPRLESERLVDKYFDPAMRALAPGFDDVETVRTLRDDHKLWVPQIGVGRLMGRHWSLYAQGGYTAGKVRTKADDRSIILAPLHTDFEIERGALSTTFGADFFPWGTAELRDYDGVWDRLRAVRPKAGTSVTWTYATFTAKVKAGFKPAPNFLNLKLSDSWYLPSLNMNVGAQMPLGKRSSLDIGVGYNFFGDEKQDFEGPAFTLTWNYFFK